MNNNTLFILSKATRHGDPDSNDIWIFSTAEKRDEFIKEFKLKDNEEEMYTSWETQIDRYLKRT